MIANVTLFSGIGPVAYQVVMTTVNDTHTLSLLGQ